MKLEKNKAANILAAIVFLILAGIIIYSGFAKPAPGAPIKTVIQKTASAPFQSFPPQEINGLSLLEHKTGSDVIAELKVMHGGSENVKINDAHFLKYAGKEGGSAATWIGITDTEEGARMLTTLMTQRIKNSSKFSLQEMTLGSTTVYNLKGLGFEENYYYSIGSKTVWIGVSGLSNLDVSKLIEELNLQIVKF